MSLKTYKVKVRTIVEWDVTVQAPNDLEAGNKAEDIAEEVHLRKVAEAMNHERYTIEVYDCDEVKT